MGLERIQLWYFKRLLGLNERFNSLVIRGDLGLDTLWNKRLVKMVKFWERIKSLPEDRLVMVAYREMIKDNRNNSWPNQIRKILNSCGITGIWNQEVCIRGEIGSVAKEVKIVLQEQDIQLWQASQTAVASLYVYVEVKEAWGEEYYFKVELEGGGYKVGHFNTG